LPKGKNALNFNAFSKLRKYLLCVNTQTILFKNVNIVRNEQNKSDSQMQVAFDI